MNTLRLSPTIYTPKFEYQKLSRETIDGSRRYLTPDGQKLPSVTTILSATKSQESIDSLQKWRNRVGHAKAQTISTEAAGVGTTMHKMLEEHCLGKSKPPGTNTVQQIAHPMAQQIIQHGLVHLDECWGNELSLYYSGLYAGSTDCAGVWKKKEAILDFKQSNKEKKKEWIDDYFIQTVFYGTAHNHMFNTNIQTGVILVCTRDCKYQEFVIEGEEWLKYENQMWNKVEQYYTQL